MRIHSIHQLIEKRRDEATKPFKSRGAKVKRCQYCQIALEYCICHLQPDIDCDVAALILMSDAEILKPSNTGRLIADAVKETYAFKWDRTSPDLALIELLSNDAYCPVLVFPEEYVESQSRVINDVTLVEKPDKKLLLVFIDSSWREARKIFRKSPYLDLLPVLSITPDAISQYMMRKSEKENHLSTAEVASLVLKNARQEHASIMLDSWFKVFRESYMLSKTRIKHDLSRPVLQAYIIDNKVD